MMHQPRCHYRQLLGLAALLYASLPDSDVNRRQLPQPRTPPAPTSNSGDHMNALHRHG
jgi:hypothetical protein